MNRQGEPVSRPISGVPAVVIGYDAGRGVLLVQHRQCASLNAAVENYLAAPKSKKVWFAKFKWNAIDAADQEQIQSLRHTKRASVQGKRSTSRRAKRASVQEESLTSVAISAVLSGMVVSCTLVKKPTWEAVQISVDFECERFKLPTNVAKSELPSSHSDPGKNRFTERLRGISKSGRSNLGHPWRG